MVSRRARKVKPKARPKARASSVPAPRALHYKVVELNAVDERSLERTLNEWCPQGWTFDGVQFAMRESSKRPAMAFVFFTREGAPLPEPTTYDDDAFRTDDEASAHLRRLASAQVQEMNTEDAWSRLQALAGDEDES